MYSQSDAARATLDGKVSASEQVHLLDVVSDNNLLCFYNSELLQIEEGGRAVKLLPKNVIKKFIKMGVLNRFARRPLGKSLL